MRPMPQPFAFIDASPEAGARLATCHCEGSRIQQGFDFFEEQDPVGVLGNQPGGRQSEDIEDACDFVDQCSYAGLARRPFGLPECSARSIRVNASHADPGDDQVVSRSESRWQRRELHLGELPFGGIDLPDQQQATDADIPRVGGVHPVATRFERCACAIEPCR